jgi:lipopolysaccharide export system protein LptA
MPLPVYRLRRLLAATAVILILVVAAMIFYARLETTNVLKTIPGKIGYDVKQTARGFQISKSDGKRTLFTVQAKDVKQFKLNGNAELHDVSIILYGRDSSRFDQIYGDDFAFNQKTGEIIAKGEVQIDLVSNPAGLASPDQATPKEVKNPIHLKTRDLVFNKDTGDASTDARVEFRTPQASGWAVGVKYAGKSNTLSLASQIHIELKGPEAAIIEAVRGTVTNDPRQIMLENPRLTRGSGSMQADHATLDLSPENHVNRVLATGNVIAVARTAPAKAAGPVDQNDAKSRATETDARANEAEFFFVKDEDLLHTATLRGSVHIEQSGPQPLEGDAERVILDFAGQNQLQSVHALDGTHLMQRGVQNQTAGKSGHSNQQDFDLRSPAIDFTVADGHILRHAVTSGAAEITISQAQPSVAATGAASREQQTVVTAGKFAADFAADHGHNQLAKIHGAPDARIVSSAPGEPDRTSTSDSVDALFLPQGGIDSLTQTGNLHYVDGQSPDKQTQAWANSGRYTPADQMLILIGGPRITQGGMATTANTMRINRATGEALAEGDVKTTYSELKEQPDGALLASASPIHVSAHTMTAHKNPGVALYTGNARLWQDANIIEAPSIQFDRDRRFVIAQGTSAEPVKTTLFQSEKPSTGGSNVRVQGKAGVPPGASPIAITAPKLTYMDSERMARYECGVAAKGEQFTATGKTADAYLLPAGKNSRNGAAPGAAQLDKIVAAGDVIVQQPNRKAQGQKLVYTAAEDKFVMTGGPPSIFDAEQGKITGVSLTFFRRDDRVLVEGGASTSAVTTTRVAR